MMMMMMMIRKGTENYLELYTFNVNQQMPKIRQNHNNVIIRKLHVSGLTGPSHKPTLSAFFFFGRFAARASQHNLSN